MKRSDFILILGTAMLAFTAVPSIAAQAAAPSAASRFASDRISVVVQGSGPDVILIPGLTASRDMWRGTVAAVPGYRYHLVQVNGFAGTKAGGNASGPVVQPVAEEIARYIAASKLEAPALIGHSMGGTLAMMIAARRPEKIGRVMVVDMLPQPAGLFGGNASGLGSLADRLASTPSGRRLLGGLIGRFGADEPGRESDPDVVARATNDLARTDLAPELPRIRVPMMILFATPGANAPDHPRIVQNYRVSYAGAKTAKLRPIPESGHMIMYDQPARFRAEVKAFLSAR
jgi:N-formylmaleamate deformylase